MSDVDLQFYKQQIKGKEEVFEHLLNQYIIRGNDIDLPSTLSLLKEHGLVGKLKRKIYCYCWINSEGRVIIRVYGAAGDNILRFQFFMKDIHTIRALLRKSKQGG